MTLPIYQRFGYGRFLIDFSYLLSKKENLPGTPEKPLSDLGKISYQSYWKYAVLNQLRNKNVVTIEDISRETGMNVHDIAATLHDLGSFEYVKRDDGSMGYDVTLDASLLSSLRTPKLLTDEEQLKWTPLILPTAIETDRDLQNSCVRIASGPVGPAPLKPPVIKNKTDSGEVIVRPKKRKRRVNKTGYNGRPKRKRKIIKEDDESSQDMDEDSRLTGSIKGPDTESQHSQDDDETTEEEVLDDDDHDGASSTTDKNPVDDVDPVDEQNEEKSEKEEESKQETQNEMCPTNESALSRTPEYKSSPESSEVTCVNEEAVFAEVGQPLLTT